MHDLDRTQLETQFELETAGETALGEILGEAQHGAGGAETQELELASRLLGVQSEDELEQFIGDLVSSAVRGARALVATPTGQALTGILKDAAKQALPMLGGAVGSYVSPGSGQAWGERAGRTAADLLGLELEGLSHEDREFGVARRVVEFGREAARNLADAQAVGHVPHASAQAGGGPAVAPRHMDVPPGHPAAAVHYAAGTPAAQIRREEWAVARDAAAQAAGRFMPGLVPQLAARPRPGVAPEAIASGMPRAGSPSAVFAAVGPVGPRTATPAFAPAGRAPSPAAVFASEPRAVGWAPPVEPRPVSVSPSSYFAGSPVSAHGSHHLPLEGRWIRRGRALIVLPG